MEELIAKRYVKALASTVDAAALEKIATTFGSLACAYQDEPKFQQILVATDVSNADKAALLLDAVASAKSEPVNNMMKLLVQNGRVAVIPAIAKELKKAIARQNKSYTGAVYSNSGIDAKTLEGLSAGLGKKVDASIALEFVQTDFNGIKLEVEDLGIEINFSKSRMDMQLVEHILKAI